ncbi:unnamed protein product [Prunus armeniaca]|uniref:F-box domain-containing protein n=1 Tax=Prunus armeniaca TaxID=36596 RepID=A0A6J5TG05_PRUAR|nr:unnamed protein product [Prunus armeniaca]
MNNMNPSKRAANRAATCSKDRERLGEKWQQPRSPCPCTNFQQLPQAIAMEILLRLSMKTLFNCRCVCKEWLSLISDPQFIHPHLSRSRIGILIKKYPHNLKSWKPELTHVEECAESDLWVDTINFTDNVPISEFGLVNSCNGLVCLSGPHKYDPCYVCNPILGEFIIIPPTQKGRGWCSFVGFGFSVRTNEYKLLQTSLSDNFCKAEAEIYTIGTGLWRSIGNAPMDFPELPFNSYLQGALHWVSYGEKKSFREIRITGTQSLFSFDAIAYSPSFVSLYDASRGEEVKRVRTGNKSDKLLAVGSSDCVGSGMPPYKCTKLN